MQLAPEWAGALRRCGTKRKGTEIVRQLFAFGITAALLLPAPALAARTLAVLPLEQAAGSEEHAGLGTALAGMLVSDLSRVEALQLVERSRLGELLGEIELTSSGFLDPATAQQLGQGLGAELVVTGSYSVVQAQFLLDARVIEVETAAVLHAVDAQGTADDFVTVEKDLVEALLEGMEVQLASGVRRKILADAPTESFNAFSAYGEGLDHQAAGRVEEAKRAFESAVNADHEFVAAREALSVLRTLVEEEQAKAAGAKQDARDSLHYKVLAAFPDERDLPADHEHDTASLAGLSLRWLVLREQGRHCQCYAEMFHYLDRVQWQVTQPVPWGGDDDLFLTTMRAAIEIELIEYPRELRTIPFDRPDVASYPSLFSDTDSFVLDLTAGNASTTVGRGLIATMKHCHGPAEQLAEMEKIQARVAKYGVGGAEESPDYPGVTFDHHLESQWGYLHARHFGVDDRVQARMEALVDALDGEESRAWAVRRTDRVVQAGDLWDRWHVARRGLPDDVLVAVTQAVAEKQGGPLDWDNPYCAKAAEMEAHGAEISWKRYQKDVDREDRRHLESTVSRMGGVATTLLDLGCIEGYPGVATDVYEVYAFVGTAEDRKRADHAGDEDCVRAFESILNYVDPAKLDHVTDQEDLLTMYAVQALNWYYGNLLTDRCVEDVRR